MYDMLSPEERQQFDAENCRLVEDYNDPEKRTAAFAEVREVGAAGGQTGTVTVL